MTVISSPTEQAAYEAPLRTRYAVIAFIAGIFVVASLLVQEIGYHNTLTEETQQLITIHKRFPLDMIGAVLDAIGLIATGVLLWWLNTISLARDPKLSPMTRYLIMLGAPPMALLEVAEIVFYSIKAESFWNGHNYGYPEAYKLIHPIAIELLVFQLAEELGALLLAAGFIWASLNAMKVGLLPRPMGYAGLIAGALVIFSIGPISFVAQGAWLVAAAVIISGRWPSDPSAWREGMAIPWLAGGKPNRDAAARAAADAGVTAVVLDDGPVQQQAGDYTPRRKKKKR